MPDAHRFTVLSFLGALLVSGFENWASPLGCDDGCFAVQRLLAVEQMALTSRMYNDWASASVARFVNLRGLNHRNVSL